MGQGIKHKAAIGSKPTAGGKRKPAKRVSGVGSRRFQTDGGEGDNKIWW